MALLVALEDIACQLQKTLLVKVKLEVRSLLTVCTAEEVIGHLDEEVHLARVEGGGGDGDSVGLDGRYPRVLLAAAEGNVVYDATSPAEGWVGGVVEDCH